MNSLDISSLDWWPQAAADQPGGLFLSPPWMRALNATYGFDVQVIVVEDEAGRSALPYVVVDDIRGPRCRVLPFSDVAAFPLATAGHWQQLEAHLLSLGASLQLIVPEDLINFDEDHWTVDRSSVWHHLDLSQGEDALFSAYSSAHRNRIRKVQQSGFVINHRADEAGLDTYFELHRHVRKYRHHLLSQPRTLFSEIGAQFFDPGNDVAGVAVDGTVITVEHDENVAAAALLLRYGDTAYYKFSASSPEHRNLGVNKALVHGCVQWAIAQGCVKLDLGRTDLDPPGLLDFKRRFGASATPLLTATRSDAELPAAAADAGQLLGHLTGLLTRPDVPDDVTQAAADELYRYFA